MNDSEQTSTNTGIPGVPRAKLLRIVAFIEFSVALIFAMMMLLNVEGMRLIFGIVTLMMLFSGVMLILASAKVTARDRERAMREGIGSVE